MTMDDLAQITAPRSWSGDDDVLDPSTRARCTSRFRPVNLAVVPAASQVLPMEKPAELGRIISEFLAGDAAPKTWMSVRRSASTTTPEP